MSADFDSMKKVRIVSDGTPVGTRVFNYDGSEIPNIARIEIMPIAPDCLVRARIEIGCVELGCAAEHIGDGDGRKTGDA
ncbi:hypothetical protein WJ73_19460 [Burkholderia ubonensis]|nr:hypothetical protein WJ73_19460 [Burkholderia ubonensis]